MFPRGGGGVRTHSELETVPRVRVDVTERLLHGQSEQNQLAQVVPGILTLLDALERRMMGNVTLLAGMAPERRSGTPALTCLSGERPEAAM